MQVLNPLSASRAEAAFSPRTLPATCQASDAAGDCVYVTGDMSGGRYLVSKSDPNDPAKLPAIGVLVAKLTATECTIQVEGALEGLYSGLLPGRLLYVGNDGRPTHAIPAVAQIIGVASSTTGLVVNPVTPLGGVLSPLNRDMQAATTVTDNSVACVTPMLATPPPHAWLQVQINGIAVRIGNGTRAAVPCYFSGDGGLTARATGGITVGDLLYWNGSVAGFQLDAATDRIDFLFEGV